MGQRTMLYTIAENKDGKMKVKGYYHQWGIGRIMPEAAMGAIIGCYRRNRYGDNYDFCDHLELGNAKGAGFLLEYSEEFAANDKLAHYVWNNPTMIGEMVCRHDNNNGALVVYAKEAENEKDVEFRIGFLLGYEDAWSANYPDCNQANKDLGPAFNKWLTFEEWAALDINDCVKHNFRKMFKLFCDEYNVKIKSWDN